MIFKEGNRVKNPQFLSLKLWVDTHIGFDSRHLGAVANKTVLQSQWFSKYSPKEFQGGAAKSMKFLVVG